MRDAFLSEILNAMHSGENIFFLTADLGAPALDQIRSNYPDRFLNVGIAEQNLINVATGLALEGLTVYAYAIAPFITTKCFEQIRVNLAILSQLRPVNVNLIGVGAGFSYDILGPTHHCLEDLSIMRTLPNFEVISPSDPFMAARLYRFTADCFGPKYLRLDAKPLPDIHTHLDDSDISDGFVELEKGEDVCLVSTGYMTQKALQVCEKMQADGKSIGMVDLIRMKGFSEDSLAAVLRRYRRIVSLEEGFIGKGGVDSVIGNLILTHRLPVEFKAFGLRDKYLFEVTGREKLHAQSGLDTEAILKDL